MKSKSSDDAKPDAGKTILKRGSQIPWQIIDHNALLLTPKLAMAHEFNETATWIWQQLESDSSIENLTSQMCDAFEIDPQTAEKDIREFAQAMSAHGIIECL